MLAHTSGTTSLVFQMRHGEMIQLVKNKVEGNERYSKYKDRGLGPSPLILLLHTDIVSNR